MTKIEQVIVERGLKKTWIAKQIEISPSTMTNIIKGGIPTLPVAIKMARLLEMTVEELWGHLVK